MIGCSTDRACGWPLPRHHLTHTPPFQASVTQYLLDKFATVNTKNDYGCVPLHAQAHTFEAGIIRIAVWTHACRLD